MCPESPTGYLPSVGSTCTIFGLATQNSPRETLEQAIELAQKAIAMDDSLSHGHTIVDSYIFRMKGLGQGDC